MATAEARMATTTVTVREEQSWQPSSKPVIEETVREEKEWTSNDDDFELEELEEEVGR